MLLISVFIKGYCNKCVVTTVQWFQADMFAFLLFSTLKDTLRPAQGNKRCLVKWEAGVVIYRKIA